MTNTGRSSHDFVKYIKLLAVEMKHKLRVARDNIGGIHLTLSKKLANWLEVFTNSERQSGKTHNESKTFLFCSLH